MTRIKRVNTVGGSISKLFPTPRIAKRAPTAADGNFPQGQHWIDEDSQAFYFLVAFTSAGAVWQSNTSSGTTATVFTVNPGDLTVTAGDFFVLLGDSTFGGAITVTGLTTLGDVTVSGTLTFTGDIDLESASAIDLTSTQNAAECIKIWAKDGNIQTLKLLADTSTLVNSIDIESTVGGITLTSGLASDDAINFVASAGGIDMNAATQINITSSENTTDAIQIFSSNGGMLITAGGTSAGEDIFLSNIGGSIRMDAGEAIADAFDLNSTGGFDLDAALQVALSTSQASATAISLSAASGGIDLTAGGAAAGPTGDLDITSTLGSINLTAGEAVAGAVLVDSTNGGIQLISGTDTAIIATAGASMQSFEAAADAIRIVASNAAGGIDIDSGTAGVDLDTTGIIALTTTSVTGPDINLTANTAGGGYRLTTSTGGITNQTSGLNQLTSSLGAGLAVSLDASTAGGIVRLDSGSGGIEIGVSSDCTPISLGDVIPTVNRAFTIAGGLISAAVTDTIDIAPDGVDTAGGSSKIVNLCSGNTTLGVQQVNILGGNRVSGTHTFNASTGTGTKIINFGNADALTTFNIDATTLINDSINANTSINTGTSTGTVDIGNALSGVIGITSVANIDIDAGTSGSFVVNGAGDDLVLRSAGGKSILRGGEAVADAIVIESQNAAGGIDMNAGTGGVAIDSTGAISIDAVAGNFTASGAASTLTLSSTAGSVIIDGGEAGASSVKIDASDAAGGIDIDAGTAGIAIDIANGPYSVTTGTGNITIGIDGTSKSVQLGSSSGTSSMTILSGTGDISIVSTDEVRIDATGVLELNSISGVIGIGNDANANNINIGTGAAARAITIGNSTGATSVAIASGTGNIAIGANAIAHNITVGNSTGATSVDIQSGTGALNVGTNGIAHNITIGNSTGATSVTLDSGTAGIDIGTNAVAQSITIGNSTGATTVDVDSGTGPANFGANATDHATNIGSTTGASTTTIQGGSSGIVLNPSGATGSLNAIPATNSAAAASLTLNAHMGVATFTGLTTASGADEDFTITNSILAAGDGIFLTMSNKGTNDADMTVEGIITQTAGTITVHAINNGPAALNGDVIIMFWVPN